MPDNAITDGIDEAITKNRAKITDEYDQKADTAALKGIRSFIAGIVVFAVATVFGFFKLTLVAQICAGIAIIPMLATFWFYIELENIWADKRRWLSSLKN